MFTTRHERPPDIPAIRDLLTLCFPTDAEARLVHLLRVNNKLPLSLVAEAANRQIVGHIAYSPITTPQAASTHALGLAPLAVAEPFRRQGVAAMLVRDSLIDCRRARFGWVVVLGEPAYYRRFGFRPASDFGLIDEYNAGPAFQALELIEGTLPRNAGLVRYAPEFASLDS